MNKEEFNRLSIDKQVEYINTQLENISLNKACDSLGLSESTVRDRFKRNNYKRIDKKFVHLETTDKIIPLESKVKPAKKLDNLDTIKLLEEKIKTLESNLEATNKRIDDIANNTTNTNTTVTTFTTFEGDVVVRSFRLNEEVQQRFKTYCKAHSNYKVSDILSTILDEYLKKQDY